MATNTAPSSSTTVTVNNPNAAFLPIGMMFIIIGATSAASTAFIGLGIAFVAMSFSKKSKNVES